MNQDFEKIERDMFSAAVHLADNSEEISGEIVDSEDFILVSREDFQDFQKCLHSYRSGRKEARAPFFLPGDFVRLRRGKSAVWCLVVSASVDRSRARYDWSTDHNSAGCQFGVGPGEEFAFLPEEVVGVIQHEG